MSDTGLVSIVVATCYREQDLLECLKSLLNQDYRNCEVLIVDQDSGRSLERTLAAHFPDDSRLRYLHLTNGGAARSRNLGIMNARGAVVAFIDDDAVAEPGWIAAIAESFSSSPAPALVAGRIWPLWITPRPDWYPKEREFLLGLYDIGDHVCAMPPHDQPIGANMAGLRSVILEHGGFDERLGPNYFRKHSMITGEDAILGRRIRQAGYDVIYQPRATVHHRVSSRKLTRKYFLQRHYWEGVTTVNQLVVLGELGKKSNHYAHHLRSLFLALARFLLPGYQNYYALPTPVIRMLALSRAAFHLGILHGLMTLGRAPSASATKSCESA